MSDQTSITESQLGHRTFPENPVGTRSDWPQLEQLSFLFPESFEGLDVLSIIR